jgi:hypothetical protein
MGLVVQGHNLVQGAKSMEMYCCLDTEIMSEALHLRAERVYADTIKSSLRMLFQNQFHGVQQSGLVFHPIESGHMKEAPRRAGGWFNGAVKGALIDSEWYPERIGADWQQWLKSIATPSSDCGGPA